MAAKQRRHQIAHRVDSDHAQGVDFLRNLHGADARRDGRAGTPGDEDPGDQRGKLARHRQGDTEHHLPLGTEGAQRINALDGQHHPGGEGGQRDDGNRIYANADGFLEHRAQAHRLTPPMTEQQPVKRLDHQRGVIADFPDHLQAALADLRDE
nr:hypothetical protein [Propionivibrio sp.]